MDIANIIQTIAIYALPVLFAITMYGVARSEAARYFGDTTAEEMGRITLNPLQHIDPIGTIAVPLLLYFATGGAFLFGYAKALPLDFSRLRNPKRDMIWISLAGPMSNFAQAFIWGLSLLAMRAFGVEEPFFLKMAQAGVQVNLVMWAFNLFPLPPLDGGRILMGFLPMKQAMWLSRVEPWGFFIVLGLAVIGVVGTVWLRPLMSVGYAVIGLLLTPLMLLLR
ncbi:MULTISPECIES: site-2 protease family protein [unclassified Polaromonas]|uniref:site-2 protease family protein n=1 Tax=unclassified Polaromonas TaxID=2638319 RepID=UPI000F08EF92|nr:MULTISPECIES: site-2 protease family protein [unclassified Polaromonas]AYQ28535.1 site-2 protease family protein [Polaromonas sp. SP1]QGJ20349.1 site-2 protease family protein [Polaromonas sp. Pch-P]